MTHYTFQFIMELLQLFSSKVVETSNLLKLAINTFIMQTDSQPIVQQTAKEYFFGYENAFTKFGHTLMPHWIKFDKIGLLDQVKVKKKLFI